MVGTRSRTGYYNFIIHAPGLHQAHDHGPGVVYWQINPEIPSILANMDEGDLWSFGPNVALDDNGMSDDEVVALVKRATGIDLPYRSEEHTSELLYLMRILYAVICFKTIIE